ncbi:hypothetical protein [Roseateles sp. L2-2]|uniref:hypothetical protein n=1 Tax=Roseateles TaxID=93681 RepID=UPI003D36661B
MALYTFIMDYDGGTYISQIRATSHLAAMRKWARTRTPGEISGMGVKGFEELANAMDATDAANFNGAIVNTWCTSALVRGKLALINFVKTHEA